VCQKRAFVQMNYNYPTWSCNDQTEAIGKSEFWKLGITESCRNMETDYWNGYYSECGDKLIRQVPSQFAAFVLGELSEAEQIVEFGCGLGRDSFFFNGFGFDVVGVDGSEAAVVQCRTRANGRPGISFLNRDVSDAALVSEISGLRKSGVSLMLYARFFLHAIDETSQEAFLMMASDVCKPKDRMALEFRTDHDKDGVRETATHYRRYIKMEELITAASQHGFRDVYSVEGRGFAKYKSDDAVVARVILEKT